MKPKYFKHEEASAEQFMAIAPERFSFLEDSGFLRAPEFEILFPGCASLVYIGKYVGFTISLDVRDRCVDAFIVEVENGKIKDGGYRSGLLTHLIKKGYRGGFKAWEANGDRNFVITLDMMVNKYVELLKQHAQLFLTDTPESLRAET